jgi:hypothetical protein
MTNCQSIKNFVDGAHECFVKGQGDMPCCTNFIIMSPLMIVASTIRLVVNAIFGILALIATIVCCCGRKSRYESLSTTTCLAFQNAGASILHIILSVLNIATLGYLISSCRNLPEFDSELKSALVDIPENDDE